MSAADARNVERLYGMLGTVAGIGALLIVAALTYPAARDLLASVA
jgi:hypothetical protein